MKADFRFAHENSTEDIIAAQLRISHMSFQYHPHLAENSCNIPE